MRYALFSTWAALLGSPASAELAKLVDERGLIDNIPIGTITVEDEFGDPGFAVSRGDGVSDGFVEGATLLFDFGGVRVVESAELTLNIDTIFSHGGSSPTIEMFVYYDDNGIPGTIDLTDIFLGAQVVWDSFQYDAPIERTIDLTDAINAVLAGRHHGMVGVRFQNSRGAFDLPLDAIEGIHFSDSPPLQFVPIPEPTIGLLVLGASACVMARRRRLWDARAKVFKAVQPRISTRS